MTQFLNKIISIENFSTEWLALVGEDRFKNKDKPVLVGWT
jgi:hypothetical protein